MLPLGGQIFHVFADIGHRLEVGDNDPQKGKKSHFGIPLPITLIFSFNFFDIGFLHTVDAKEHKEVVHSCLTTSFKILGAQMGDD